MSPTNIASTTKEKKAASGFSGLEYYAARDYRKLLWRRKWLILSITLTIAVLTSLIAYKIPNQFQASTVILVDPGKVPESYVKSTATLDANQRLALLQQQILSDAKLGQIIDEFGLYHSSKGRSNQGTMVDALRKKITIDATTGAAPARALKSFTVSFTAQ